MVGFWREGGGGKGVRMKWGRNEVDGGVGEGEGWGRWEGKEVEVLEFGNFRWVWWGCYAPNGRFRISRIWKIPPVFTSSAR